LGHDGMPILLGLGGDVYQLRLSESLILITVGIGYLCT